LSQQVNIRTMESVKAASFRVNATLPQFAKRSIRPGRASRIRDGAGDGLDFE
jgi:hypothetical protein